LPVIPEFVDHLGEKICQKIEPLAFIALTEWCSINKGSIETSEFHTPGYAHQSETHHWGTILGHPHIQQGRLQGSLRKDLCVGPVSEQNSNALEVYTPSYNLMNRCMRPRFESCLETNETPYGAGYHGRLTLGRK